MLLPLRLVALALSIVPISGVLAAPPRCDSVRWGWPGYVMGKDRWGVVLAPSKSSSSGNELVNACVSSGVSSTTSFSPVAVSTSFSNVYIPGSTSTTSSISTSSTTSTSTKTSSTSSSFITLSTTSEPSSSFSDTPSTTSTTSTTSSTPPPEPVRTSSSTPFTTTSSTPEPTPSSSSSEAPAPTTNIFSSSQGDSGSNDGGSNGSGASGGDVNEYLSTHNSIRARHGASPLAWNNTLAAAAQKWSNGCLFQHSGGSLGPFGENLAAGTGSAYGITSAVTSWTNEASEYNPSSSSASHFTQVVWKGSTQLGCAETSCAGGTIFSDSSKYYVCEYFPQGNIIGAFAANVQP